MGHVDHGKTTMLDYLRNSNIAAGEAGGITQHIGAFQVALNNNPQNLITFIDTPGHAAFSAIRQRGAQVTDLIILVVAVEDGIMPQTDEVIALSKSSKIPLIIAMSKWDRLIEATGSLIAAETSKQVRKLKDSLARRGIELEEFGGHVQCLPVSAMTGYNMDGLQESILAEAEILDLKSDPEGPLKATIIEARNVPGLGVCSTVIVRTGTLRRGIYCSTDTTYTKIKSILNTSGNSISSAGPSEPCDISGWKNSVLPEIGADAIQFNSESECKKFLDELKREKEILESRNALVDAARRETLDRKILQLRKDRSRDLSLKPVHIHTYDSITSESSSKDSKEKHLELVLHADVTGSLEALKAAISAFPSDKVKLKIAACELGPPTISTLLHLNGNLNDVGLVTFNVDVPKGLEKILAEKKIKLVSQKVIYHLLDDIKSLMASLLPPIETETNQGTAKLRQIFPLGREVIAGCTIEDGLFLRSQASNFKYNLERNGQTIWSGSIKTLKHLKKDINQAQKGMECGIVLDGLDSEILQVNDLIKCVKIISTPQKIE